MKTKLIVSNAVERLDYLFGHDPINRYLHIKRYEIAKTYCKEGSNILDLGCGLGWGTDYLSGMGKVIGVDIDKGSIIEARKRYINNKTINFVLSEGKTMPFPKDKFDVVVSMETIEHLKDANDFLNNIRRILKMNGTLILSTPNKNHFGKSLKRLFGSSIMVNPFHLHEYDEKELSTLLEKNDFEVIKIKRLLLCLPVSILNLIKNNLLLIKFFSSFTWKNFNSYYVIFARKN